MPLKRLIPLGLLSLLLAPAALLAQAQDPYPVSRVSLVTHSSPGGGTDVFLRSLTKHLTLKTNFAIENIRGGSGATAVAHVAKSAPDGSVLYGTTPTYIQTTLLSKPAVGYDGLDPLAIMFIDPEVIYTRTESPFKTLAEVVAFAKANPGKLNFAISGTGGAPHLAGIAFAQRTGINWAYIPYKGGSQAVADVASGQANVIMNGMLATYPTMKSGRIRALAISSAQRVGSAPEVPTIAETLPGFETGSYQGLLAPAGTPRDVVGKLNAEIAKILATQEMRDKLAVLGTEVRTAQPEALGTFISTEKNRWAQVIKESGIKFD